MYQGHFRISSLGSAMIWGKNMSKLGSRGQGSWFINSTWV